MSGITDPGWDRGLPAAAPTATDHQPGKRRPSAPGWLLLLSGVLVLPLAVAVALTLASQGSGSAADARVVSAADLEQEFGIRVTLVAVIADGGLVNLRFTVLDKDKAVHVLHDVESLPALYVEGSGAVLRAPRPMAHKMTVLDGASYFVLFPNSGGAIQASTPVSVVIDRVRLEPMDAQS